MMIIDDCIFKLVWQKEIFVIYRNKEKKKREKKKKQNDKNLFLP